MHLASNKYLSYSLKEATIEKENFKLDLCDLPSDETIFRINPSYKH